MPMPISAPPSDSPVGQQKKGSASSTALIPFARSSKWHIEQGNTQNGVAINVASPGTFNFAIPSYGYLSAVLLTVKATGGTGVAAVYYEDAPWSILQSVMLQDVNGTPIFQLSGYHAFLAAKFGGYRPFGPDISTFTNQYNGGTTAGNFQFILPIYLEFGRDGLGCLPNMDASARYNLQVALGSGLGAATGPVYTTAPTGFPTLSMTLEVLCRSQPPASDMYGNRNSISPPAVGTVQYWTAQTFNALTGAQTLQFSRVGNLIRNHIFVFRDTADGTRATAETTDLPPTLEFDWDAGIRYMSNLPTQRQIVLSSTGYDAPKGVVFYPNTLDPDKFTGNEYGDEWLATVGATKITQRFTPGGSCGLTVLTNDIVPASGQVYQAPMLSTMG